MLFCPSCNGEVRLERGVMLTAPHHWRYDVFAMCTSCALISGVEDDMLVDLASPLTLQDLTHPFIFESFVMAAPVPLHRRDS